MSIIKDSGTAEEKTFPSIDVLSTVTGRLMGDIRGVYQVLNWMTGESVFTSQIPHIRLEAVPVLIARHPALQQAVDEAEQVNGENYTTWRDVWLDRYGPEIAVPKFNADQHEYREPLSELAEHVHPDRAADRPVRAPLLPMGSSPCSPSGGSTPMSDSLKEAVELAFKTFSEYADLHRAKGTRDGDSKADRNAALAQTMSEALAAWNRRPSVREGELGKAIERLAEAVADREAAKARLDELKVEYPGEWGAPGLYVDLSLPDARVILRALAPRPSGEAFASPADGDTPLEAAAREAGWALSEIVDTVAWEKRSQVAGIIERLGVALNEVRPSGEGERERVARIIAGKEVHDGWLSVASHPGYGGERSANRLWPSWPTALAKADAILALSRGAPEGYVMVPRAEIDALLDLSSPSKRIERPRHNLDAVNDRLRAMLSAQEDHGSSGAESASALHGRATDANAKFEE